MPSPTPPVPPATSTCFIPLYYPLRKRLEAPGYDEPNAGPQA